MFAVVAIAALAGVWAWLTSRTYGEAQNDAISAASTATRLAQENFLWTVRSVDLVLEMADRAMGQDSDPARLDSDEQAELAKLVKRLPYIGAIWVSDAEGRLRYATSRGAVDLPVQDRSYFQAHKSGALTFISPELRGRITGEVFFSISRRMERNGKFAGVVLAAFDPSYFPAFGRSLALGHNAEVTIVTGDGTPVVGTAAVYSNAIPSLWQGFNRSGRHGEFDTARRTVGNTEYFIAQRPIPEFGLATLYIAPWSDLMQAWTRRFWLGTAIIALAVTVIVAGAALAMTFGRRQAHLRDVLGLRTVEVTRSNERLELAVEATGIGIFDYDTQRKSLAWAGVGPGHFGLPSADQLTPSNFMRHVHPADRLTLVRELRRLRSRQSDGAAAAEFRMRHPEAGQIWVAARGRIFGSPGQRPHRVIGTVRDITEQRLLQEHKDTVLREINHRIKNSLQLMNSIMNLQSRRIPSAEERSRFEVARRRLVALATVYAHLDDTSRPDSVEVASFLRRLCRDFSVAYMSDGRSALAFTSDGEIIVPTTQAVPLGMAVGEILVNISLQLSEQVKGMVQVDVKVRGATVEVRVINSDNVGIDAFSSAAGPLSYTLIHAFVDQIGGRLTTNEAANGGATWTISFMAQQAIGVDRPAPGGSYLSAAARDTA